MRSTECTSSFLFFSLLRIFQSHLFGKLNWLYALTPSFRPPHRIMSHFFRLMVRKQDVKLRFDRFELSDYVISTSWENIVAPLRVK